MAAGISKRERSGEGTESSRAVSELATFVIWGTGGP